MWISSSPPDKSVDYVAGIWISSSTCILVGRNFQYGSIIKSTNSGSTWTVKATNLNQLYDIAFLYNYVVVAADNGFYVSTDSGETWIPNLSFLPSFYDVTIGSNGNIFAGGAQTNYPVTGVMYTTTISALFSWTQLTLPSSLNVPLNGVQSCDGNQIIAVGNSGTIIVSANSGSTWTQIFGVTSANLYSVSCASSSFFMIGGSSSALLVTNNGGNSWTSLTPFISTVTGISSASNFLFHSISALSTSVAFAASTNGVVLVSTNGGFQWQLDQSLGSGTASSPQSLYCLSMSSSSKGVVGTSRGNPLYIKTTGAD